MDSKRLKTTLTGIGLAFAMAFGLVLFSGIEVNAQDRDYRDDRYNDRDYRRDDRYRDRRGRDDDRYENRNSNRFRQAMQRGYRDGLREGVADARSRRRDYRQSRLYRSGIDGYDSRWGGRSSYQRAYRIGFERGYRDGLERYRNRRGY